MSTSELDFSDGYAEWDFTTSMSKAYTTGGNPMRSLSDGRFAMFAADSDIDGQVIVNDFNDWLVATKAGMSGYHHTDFDMDGRITASDFNFWLANTKIGASSRVPD